eukprot:scaffold22078_cov84-Skeletonema_dohrnii-CCMP3373.AAC.2
MGLERSLLSKWSPMRDLTRKAVNAKMTVVGKVSDFPPPSPIEELSLLDAVNRATPYYAFGGATVSGSDQANSLSQAHRDAAFMVALLFTADEEANFWGNLFPQMYEDWTKPCPREWTFEERGEKCISLQEAIYGTERLARLEAIKKAVDPQFICSTAPFVLEIISPRHPSLRMTSRLLLNPNIYWETHLMIHQAHPPKEEHEKLSHVVGCGGGGGGASPKI